MGREMSVHIYDTAENESLFRIEEESGAAITVSVEGRTGRILSLFVPEENRRKGLGRLLISCAEKALAERNGKMIDTFFPDQNEDLTGFFRACGFTQEEEVPILSVSTETISRSPSVKRIIEQEHEGMEFQALSELFMVQWDELLEVLNDWNIKLNPRDINRFDDEISGVVYDSEFQPQTVVLCSCGERTLNVELLLSREGLDPEFMLCALQNMLVNMELKGGSAAFPTLTLIAANKGVNPLIEKLTMGDRVAQKKGSVLRFLKAVEPEAYADLSILEGTEDRDPERLWWEEIKDIPYQLNISYKMKRYRKLKEEESGPGIDFEKREDESGGLISEENRRITNDNLELLSKFLPSDVKKNLKRPYYHGLVSGGTLLVWEIRSAEEETSESELICFREADASSGKEIFRDYAAEVAKSRVKRSFFELTGLNEPEKELLSTEGFTLTERESRDMVLSLGEMGKLPVLKKKPAAHVKPIKILSDKQYKRVIASCLFHGRKGLLQDIGYLPKEWFDMEVSSCCITDQRVDGVLLIHETGDGMLMIDLLFSIGSEYQRDLVMMMRYSLRAALEKYGGEKQVLIRRHTSAVSDLTKKLFPRYKGMAAVYGEREEELNDPSQ